ncbi:MAG: hypothetical protein D6824_08525 [Planctomycetota bacterium]|nr:MAG: hypothetical protein D6824_08525 [Planctomycetota bacterium]
MLTSLSRILIVLLSVAVIEQTLVLWEATGASLFTYYYNAERAREARQTNDLANLFEDASGEEQSQEIPPPPNRFMLGLLPSLPPDRAWRVWDKDLVSVTTLAGPAAAIALLTLLSWAGERRKVRHATRTPPRNESPTP